MKNSLAPDLVRAVAGLPYQFLREHPLDQFRLWTETEKEENLPAEFSLGIPVPLVCWGNGVQARVAAIILLAKKGQLMLNSPHTVRASGGDEGDWGQHDRDMGHRQALHTLAHKRIIEVSWALQIYLVGWDGSTCLNQTCQSGRFMEEGRRERGSVFCTACQTALESELRGIRRPVRANCKSAPPQRQLQRVLCFRHVTRVIQIAA